MLPITSPLIVEPGPVANDLQAAILRTVLYADVFSYPLTLAEIHDYLIGLSAPRGAVWAALGSEPLRARLIGVGGYYMLRERAHLAALRLARQGQAARLWKQARRWAALVGALPFVRMVAVTGALAMDNVPAGDDIDLMVVTAPGRVWLARALCVALVYAARLARVHLCPNYVLSQSALAQTPRDLYIAHELAQTTPLVGHALYAQLRAANTWTRFYLPQAGRPPRQETDQAPRGPVRWAQRLGEWLLAGRLGGALERWEQARKRRKFSRLAAGSSAARLDAERVKGHFDDHGRWVLDEYRRRIAAFDLE